MFNIILTLVVETRKSVRELENYRDIDNFNSLQFEKDLMVASRIKYDDPAGLRAKLIYTDTEAEFITRGKRGKKLDTGYKVTTEYVADPSNKGL